MSQSDYIKFKKIATEMNSQTEFSPETDRNYTGIKKFYVGNNVKDTTVYFNKLVKSDKQVVFDMEVSNGGLRRFPDVREDQRAGLSRSDEGRYTPRTVRTYVKHPPVSACRSYCDHAYYDKRGNITT
jgi:hypothetical protein